MITAKKMRGFFGDSVVNKKLEEFLDKVMMEAMVKQKSSPIDVDLSDIQKYVGSKRVDLADMTIKILKDSGYKARIEIKVGVMCGIEVVRVWW